MQRKSKRQSRKNQRPRKVRSNQKKTTLKTFTAGDFSISEWNLLIQSLIKSVKKVKAQHVNSENLKDEIKSLVVNYFQTIRAALSQQNSEVALLDEKMQTLLSFRNTRTLVSSYLRELVAILKQVRVLEAQQIISGSGAPVTGQNSEINTVEQDTKIINVLTELLPRVALSYQQVILDLSSKRLSFKGTACELREILREVLDHLAPDSNVLASDGFKLEKDRSGPTMKQKVRYILKMRDKTKSAIEAPENATAVVEESIAKLARATYDRSSISIHAETEKREIQNLKRYLDSVLCELLEIY